jgi:hypothetical protein
MAGADNIIDPASMLLNRNSSSIERGAGIEFKFVVADSIFGRIWAATAHKNMHAWYEACIPAMAADSDANARRVPAALSQPFRNVRGAPVKHNRLRSQPIGQPGARTDRGSRVVHFPDFNSFTSCHQSSIL